MAFPVLTDAGSPSCHLSAKGEKSDVSWGRFQTAGRSRGRPSQGLTLIITTHACTHTHTHARAHTHPQAGRQSSAAQAPQGCPSPLRQPPSTHCSLFLPWSLRLAFQAKPRLQGNGEASTISLRPRRTQGRWTRQGDTRLSQPARLLPGCEGPRWLVGQLSPRGWATQDLVARLQQHRRGGGQAATRRGHHF